MDEQENSPAEMVQAELVERDIKSKENEKPLIPGLGMYAVKGGPGRGKGTLNKTTAWKNGMFAAWKAAGGNERLIKIIKEGSNAEVLKYADLLVEMTPKEIGVDITNTDERIINIIFPGEINNTPHQNETISHKEQGGKS